MDTELIYKTISQKKDITFSALERELSLSNGAIGTAIKRKSQIKQTTIDKLLTLYPDLNKKWVLTGEGSPFFEEENNNMVSDSGQAYNATNPATDAGFDKQNYDLLVRANADQSDAAKDMAAAMLEMAASNKMLVSMLLSGHQSTEYDSLETSVGAPAKIEALRVYLAKSIAEIRKTSPQEIEAELNITLNEIEKIHRKGTPVGAGTSRSKVV